MLPDRRTAVLGGGALAVITALALSGCAPVGADGAYGEPANKPAGVQAPAQEPVEEAPPEEKEEAPKNKVGVVATKLTGKSLPRMGDAVADQDGFLLYMFTDDKAGKSTCVKKCAEQWPPLLEGDQDVALKGVDESLISTVARQDGGNQIRIGKWPVYRFDPDKPGKWGGQGLKNKWFIVTPTGKKNTSCLPRQGGGGNPPPPPRDEQPSDDGDNGGDGGYGDGY